MEELKIEAGKYYRAKSPRKCDDGGYNDRHVLWMGERKIGRNWVQAVQYDSPAISNGRNYPYTSLEAFLKWAGREITSEQYMDTTGKIS